MKRFISFVICFLLLITCANAELIDQITPHTSSLLYNLPIISDIIELIGQIQAKETFKTINYHPFSRIETKEFVTSDTYSPWRRYVIRKTILINVFGQELVLDEHIDSSPELLP